MSRSTGRETIGSRKKPRRQILHEVDNGKKEEESQE
jgi:hypothetical protein